MIIMMLDTTGVSTRGTDLYIWLLWINRKGRESYNHKVTDIPHQSRSVWSIWRGSREILHLNHYRGEGGGIPWKE